MTEKPDLDMSSEEICPQAPADDPLHCVHWWEGEKCCRCDAGPMSEEEKRKVGMIP